MDFGWIMAFFPVLMTVISLILDALLPPSKMAWICLPDLFAISLFSYQMIASMVGKDVRDQLSDGQHVVLSIIITLDVVAICCIITAMVLCCKLVPRPAIVEEENDEEAGETSSDQKTETANVEEVVDED